MTPANDDLFATLYRGDDLSQAIQLNLNGDPLDLSGMGTTVSVCLPNEDGSELTLTLGAGISLLAAQFGKIVFTISAAQSALLALRDRMDLDFVTVIAGKTQTYSVPRALTVLDRSC